MNQPQDDANAPIESPPPPRLPRVTVSHPMTQSVKGMRASTAQVDARPAARAEDSLAFLTIMRVQLRLTARWFATLATFLGGVAAALRLIPSLGNTLVLSVPVAWWVLGALCFPALGVLAFATFEKSNDLSGAICRSPNVHDLDHCYRLGGARFVGRWWPVDALFPNDFGLSGRFSDRQPSVERGRHLR